MAVDDASDDVGEIMVRLDGVELAGLDPPALLGVPSWTVKCTGNPVNLVRR